MPNTQSSSAVIHLVAPPSNRTNTSKPLGRTIPCLLLGGALKESLTPPPPGSRVFIIGDSTVRSSAAALGLNYTDHLTPVLSKPRTLKASILNRLRTTATNPARVICWSDELIALGDSLASHFDVPLELISTKPSLIAKPPEHLERICIFNNLDHDWWNDNRHTCQTDQLLSTVIEPHISSAEERQIARRRLNIGPDTIVLGAIADSPSDVNAREFAFLLGLLAVSGYKVLGIIPKASNKLNQALRHHRGLGQPFRLLTTTDQLPDLLPLSDACIHPTDEHSGSTQLIDRYCERADIPILSIRHTGKAGFSRAQGSANHLLNQIDDIVTKMSTQLRQV